MKIYCMVHMSHKGKILYTRFIDDLIFEVEDELEKNGPIPKRGFTVENIPKFQEALKELGSSIAGFALFGPFYVSTKDMTETEYKNIPEFDGWE